MSCISGAHPYTEHPNTPCHVPRFKEPFVIGTDIVEPTRVALVCETLCLLGLRGLQGNFRTYESLQADITTVRMGRRSRIQWRHTLDLHQYASISKSPERWCPAPYPCLGGIGYVVVSGLCAYIPKITFANICVQVRSAEDEPAVRGACLRQNFH